METSEKIDFELLNKDIEMYKILHQFTWWLNLVLLLVQFAYYYTHKIKIDQVFNIFIVLNILLLYLTYKISDRYSFLKYRYKYYKNNNN